MQDLVESAWQWRDAGTSMKRRRRIVSGEIMEFLDFSTVSPRPRKTLKGVALRGDFPHAFDHRQGGQARPVVALTQPIDVVHDSYGTGFDPAMLTVNGLRAGH